MRHENADEFMAKLKERADAMVTATTGQRAAFIEGMTWGMVNELMIERDQLITHLSNRADSGGM